MALYEDLLACLTRCWPARPSPQRIPHEVSSHGVFITRLMTP